MLSLRLSRAQWAALWTATLAGIGLAYLYTAYLRSKDVSPDSIYGYGFAITGTTLLLLVGVVYPLRKRLGRRKPGRVHAFLAWHMVGGLLGLALIFMHAVGNFNPRSGTYALYGLIGVVISGVIGRVLDRFSPRLAARAALEALSANGEDRLDDLEDELAAIADDARARREELQEQGTHGTPWDLAYYDLDPEVEQIPTLLRQGVRGESGAILDLRQLSGPLAMPRQQHTPANRQSTGALARQAKGIQRAMGREQFHLHVVRVWRRLHVLISLAALGLLAWHLEYAVTLLLGAK
ncbi:MAG TPA: hypothetical protein VH590_00715 [Ktedonobacterales bacterium]